ncbi:MAG TPA: hypothetical protein VH681_00685, partial [Nitrospiraceae bacterium]
MNLVILVHIALLLGIGTVALLFSRGAAVLLLLLPASQMLGFVDPMAIAEKGLFDIHLLIAVVIAGLIAASVKHVREVREARFFTPVIVLTLLWIYGVLYPVTTGASSLFYSLKASKEFLTVLCYFGIMLFVRTERDVRWGWRCLLGLGLYYSFLEVTAQLLGESLLKQMTFDYRREGHWFWKVYLSFWPVILITFLHAFFEVSYSVRRAYFNLILGSLGLLLTFFRSYLLGVAGAIPLILAFARRGVSAIMSQFVVLGSIFAAAIVMVALFSGSGSDKGSLFDRFVTSGLIELHTQKGGALEGREAFAKERRKILRQSPFMGYGFIDKDSKAGMVFRQQVTGDMLGFIDKGDLDTALKFGYIGQVILYGTFGYLAWILIRLAKQRLQPSLNVRCLA